MKLREKLRVKSLRHKEVCLEFVSKEDE